MDTLISFFQSGGIFMYFILLIMAVGTAIALDRWIMLRRAQVDGDALWNALEPQLAEGQTGEATTLCEGNTPLHRVMGSGVRAMDKAKDREDIENAVEETMLEIMPRLESRLHYLPTLANVATLVGLLGTIMGLIEAFTSVSVADPSQKAALLSKGISLAMNTTAFGLMTAIPLMLFYSNLHARTNALVDVLDRFAFKLINLTAAHTKDKGKKK
ncbi:MAG: MotA/TolQ/ExbB proton channel family protein [Leptospirillia bacterium]